ncbi:hypothetical protein Taro_020716 [Colocasia esculenta]|uniref:Protein kinase domain-containing protein n=1 Tax=Colocasia esculenta TaxID=4460 RepID=A0A843V2X1_COLES|nr:hypothetical protein [Colocasia esculenta]
MSRRHRRATFTTAVHAVGGSYCRGKDPPFLIRHRQPPRPFIVPLSLPLSFSLYCVWPSGRGFSARGGPLATVVPSEDPPAVGVGAVPGCLAGPLLLPPLLPTTQRKHPEEEEGWRSAPRSTWDLSGTMHPVTSAHYARALAWGSTSAQCASRPLLGLFDLYFGLFSCRFPCVVIPTVPVGRPGVGGRFVKPCGGQAHPALRLTSLHPVLWHLRACPSARSAFVVVTISRDPHPCGPLEGSLQATSASIECFSGKRGKQCWIAALSHLQSSLSWSGSRGVWSVAVWANYFFLSASPYSVPEPCREDRCGTVVRPNYSLWLCFIHASHSDGRRDLDLWSSGKTPLGAPDYRLVECRVRGECGPWFARAGGTVDDGVAGGGLPCEEDSCRQVRCGALGRRRLHFRLHVFSLWLRESIYGVAFTGAGLLSAGPMEGLLPFPGTPILVGPLRVVSEPRVRPSSVSPDGGASSSSSRVGWLPHQVHISNNDLPDGVVVHWDMKPDNMLLGDDLWVKLSDFEVSTVLVPSEITHISTDVKGMCDYITPEYFSVG